MTLEQLSYLGQAVAAIGIVISIVSLAIEVRRNTNETRRQATEEATSHRSDFVRMIAADGELARLLSQGLSGNGLVAVEWFRFNMFLYAIFVEFELNQRRFESGHMEKDLWDAWLEAYRWWLQFPGVRKWWSMEPAGFTAQFRKLIAREIDSIPVGDGFSASAAAHSDSEGPAVRS